MTESPSRHLHHLFLRRSELVSLVVALAMLVAIAAFSILDWTAYRQDRNDVLATRRLLNHTSSALLSVTQAEASERGFILTGNERYLQPYRTSSAAARTQLDLLRSEAAEAAAQARFPWL